MTTTRRKVLQLGAVGALGVAGLNSSLASALPEALAQKGKPSRLRPQNRPVPFRGVFMRPPELLPFATGVDEEDGRPVETAARQKPNARRPGRRACPGRPAVDARVRGQGCVSGSAGTGRTPGSRTHRTRCADGHSGNRAR